MPEAVQDHFAYGPPKRMSVYTSVRAFTLSHTYRPSTLCALRRALECVVVGW